MEIFMEDMFQFWEARIVGDDEGTGIGVMVRLKGHDGMREEGTKNLRGDERREITSVEEGLGEDSDVSHLGDCRYAAPGWSESREWSVWWMGDGSWKSGGIAGGWWV